MSVAGQLGLVSPDADLLRAAEERWSEWALAHPVLGSAPPPGELHAWMRTLDFGPRNDVVCALGRLGSCAGADEVPAAAVLAWALVPGAVNVARRLHYASPRIDELVAAQLWLEVRTLPVTATHKVAANILARVRVAVRRDLGLAPPSDAAWSRSTVLDPFDPAWSAVTEPAPEPTPERELRAVLDGAVAREVISDRDRGLLLRLADETRPGDCTRARGGLVSRRAGQAVAGQLHLSDRQVRRRAARALDALAGGVTQRVPA
ncbi:hypothetical protein [Phycicoccus avicenniae]|uniref:hypothetical protein n=1 Tax=Phycicoccus avicenniae TaxID=2828860 RepID=UPI003D2A8123